jgi:hypothetical protein
MADYLETGESVWCINCGHHFNEHVLAPTDSPSVFYHTREYLGCKGKEDGTIECECKKFTPYQIDPEKVGKVAENAEPADKANSDGYLLIPLTVVVLPVLGLC